MASTTLKIIFHQKKLPDLDDFIPPGTRMTNSDPFFVGLLSSCTSQVMCRVYLTDELGQMHLSLCIKKKLYISMKIFNFYATMQVSTLYHALVVAREENGLKRPIIGVNLSIPFVPRELDAVKVTMKGFFPGVLLTGCESRMWVLLCVKS